MPIVNKKTGLYGHFDTSSKKKMSELVVDEIRLLKKVVDDFAESGTIRNNDRYCAESFSMYVLDPWLSAAEKDREYTVVNNRTIGQMKIMYDACVYAIDKKLYDSDTSMNVGEIKLFLERMLKHDYGQDKDFSQYKYNSTK
jgi:adenylate cyclase